MHLCVPPQAGVLLTPVTQIRRKEDRVYVGVATGMNSLIRPALYAARHNIHNLSRMGTGATAADDAAVAAAAVAAVADGGAPNGEAGAHGDLICCDVVGQWWIVIESLWRRLWLKDGAAHRLTD